MKVKNYTIKRGVTSVEKDYFRDVIVDGFNDVKKAVTGLKNNFLDYLAKTVNQSPTGSACLKVKKDFVKGVGFNDNKLKTLRVDNEGTFWTLHSKLANDNAIFHRFGILVKRELRNGKIVNTSLSHLPAEWLRYKVPTDTGIVSKIIFNPYYNTSEEFSHLAQDKEWYLYSFDEKVTKQRILENTAKIINGETDEDFYEVYFYSESNELNRTYSRPSYFIAGENVFLTEFKVWNFHNSNLDNNFFSGGILSLEGDPDSPILNNEGEQISTQGEELEKSLSVKLSGSDNAGSIITLWKSNGSSDISFNKLDADDNGDKLISIMENTRIVIPTIMNVSPLLAGIEITGKLGDSKEKEGAIKFQNENTFELREALNNAYNELLPSFVGYKKKEEISILERSEYINLPDNIWGALTFEQKTEYINNKFSQYL